MQPFSGADERIDVFCAAFVQLRKNFNSRVNLNTALVLSQTALTIDAISRCRCLRATSHALMIFT